MVQLVTTGCLCKGKSPGRPRTPQETVERMRACFQRSPLRLTSTTNRGQPIRGGPPAWGLGEGLTTHHKMDLREVGYDDRNWIKDSVFVVKGYIHYRQICQSYATASSTPSLQLTWIHFIVYGTTGLMSAGSQGEHTSSTYKRREIRTHDQRPAREKIARSKEEWRAAKRGKVNAAREWSESARASGAGREERALAFSGVPSLETRIELSRLQSQSKQASLVYRSSTRVCVRICVSIRRPEFECSGPQLEGPEFECSGPQLEGPEFEYSELSLKKCNQSSKEVEKFKYLGATVTSINDTREEIKHKINMGNACYYSFEKLLSSSLLSKNLKVRIYKTVILPVVLYGCETWTLTLREEQRLRVFENKVLRKIYGAKRDEVTGEWRKLHNTELQALYSSPGIIRNIKSRSLRWVRHVSRMGESRNAYRVLVGRPEEKRPLRRPRHRWEDNSKMDLREVDMMI
ncbi:hypothetical protein ANN_15016 [Periplaneta americana]|uniref:Reverse transcriptase domain-containing protein n=1 Tax=Periplaneta americana TaxID=6978 RepID=A0ABQ8SXW3_PERAM|nr:hypothetical protein ANN_15016 [Periplaneta americana]